MSEHIHKYKRKNLGGYIYEKGKAAKRKKYLVYACTISGCTHYVPSYLAEGKISICNTCAEAFVMTKKTMKLALPHCEDCTKKEKDVSDATLNLLGDLDL